MLIRSMLFLLITILIIGCASSENKSHEQRESPKLIQAQNQSSKKVILLIVDSLMDDPLKKAIQENKTPALAFFMENGKYNKHLVSSYPTMSVTIDSSLITGTYPDQHKIPGLILFDNEEQRIFSYGNGIFEILKLGISQFGENSLYKFNNVDLNPNISTIYEDLDKMGKQSASINALVYRGNYQHTLKIPKGVAKLANLPEKYDTMGPKHLSLGTFIREDADNKHIVNRGGINDAFATQELIYHLEKNTLPEMTLLYFSENDHTVHRKGPNTIKGLEKLDQHLQEVLNVFPNWENALEEIVWVIIGDSNQSFVKKNKKEALIDLRKALSDYNILELGEVVRPIDEIAITANERMAYIYKTNEKISLDKIAYRLKEDSRIAWVAWQKNKRVHVIAGDHEGTLSFDSRGPYKDRYNQSWSLEGNPSIMDLKVENKQIKYGNYPDGLARLYGAIHSQKGEFIVVDAKPGYEFIGESSPDHVGGGAHGSMHKIDSLSPIIVTGTEKSIDHLRIVDLKEWILDILK